MRNIKVVFLDVDGVLNTEMFRREQCDKHPKGRLYAYEAQYNFDPIVMLNLQSLVREFDAYIVISSTWRLCDVRDNFESWRHGDFQSTDRDWNQLIRNLEEWGIRDRVIGCTPSLGMTEESIRRWGHRSQPRGEEIKYWLRKHKDLDIESFVILDDGVDMEELRDTHLAWCGDIDGFNHKAWEKARQILSTPNMII